jgi:hypothetical protein
MRALTSLMSICFMSIVGIYPLDGRAEYVVSEILFVPWGEGPNELEIWEPYLEYHDGPDIDTVGHLEAAGGPSKGFVDSQENVYFISYTISYFKGFNVNGEVIVNYSQGKTEFNWEFFRGAFNDFYVDSLGRIYCVGNEMRGAYVPIADRNNNLINKLNPVGVESGIPCYILARGSNDILIFDSFDYGFYTYMNDQFYPGGSGSWRAPDGHFYSGNTASSSAIRLTRIADPDTAGIPASIDTLLIPFEPGNLIMGGLIGVDDSMRFYIEHKDSSSTEWGVRVYGQNFTLLDEFRLLPREENRFLVYLPYPFLRNDGNVYEFHCRDDGMHVFRWSKK